MTRDLLLQILAAAPGMEGGGQTFTTREDHRVSFYLGRDGRGPVINEVLEVAVAETYVQLSTEEQGEVFVPPEEVHSLAVKPLKEHAPKRTGFS